MEGSTPRLTIQVLQQQGDGCRPPRTQRRVDVPVQDVQEAQRGRPAAVPLVGAGGHRLREAGDGARSPAGTAPPPTGVGMEATCARPETRGGGLSCVTVRGWEPPAPCGESPPLGACCQTREQSTAPRCLPGAAWLWRRETAGSLQRGHRLRGRPGWGEGQGWVTGPGGAWTGRGLKAGPGSGAGSREGAESRGGVSGLGLGTFAGFAHRCHRTG